MRIFDESLNIYKLYNDEPIWIDRQDTINVIKWVVNNKINIDQFDKNETLKKTYTEYIQQNILEPLMMEDTKTFMDRSEYGKNLVYGYGSKKRNGERIS